MKRNLRNSILVSLPVFVMMLFFTGLTTVHASVPLTSGVWVEGDTLNGSDFTYTYTLPDDGAICYEICPYYGYNLQKKVSMEYYHVGVSMSAGGKAYDKSLSASNSMIGGGYLSKAREFTKGTAITITIGRYSLWQVLYRIRIVFMPKSSRTTSLKPDQWFFGETNRDVRFYYVYTLPSDGTISYEVSLYSGYYMLDGIKQETANHSIFTSLSKGDGFYINGASVTPASGFHSKSFSFTKGSTIVITVSDKEPINGNKKGRDFQTPYKVRLSFTPKDTGTDLSTSAISLSKSSYTYDGSSKKPVPTVTINGKTLISGKDYTVSYSNNTNAGTASITIKGKGTYKGSKTVSFTINPASISNASITLSKTSYTCNGKARKPSVTVKLNNKTVGSSNYTVAYANNVNPGKASAVVTGKKNYTGSVRKTFNIIPATPSLSLSSKNHGEVVAKSSTVKGATGYQVRYYKSGATRKYTRSGSSAAITLSGLTPSAEYYVQVRAYAKTSGGTVYGQYCPYKKIKVFKASRNLARGTMAFTKANANWVYTGDPVAPGVKVKYGSQVLKKGTDYTLTYSNNINPGTAKVTAKGIGKYYGSISKTYKINKETDLSKEIDKIKKDFEEQKESLDRKGRSVIDSVSDAYETEKEERSGNLEKKIDAVLALDPATPKAVHEALLDALVGRVADTLVTAPSAYNNCRTGAELVMAVMNQMGNNTGSFTFKAENNLYTVKTSSISGFGASFTSGTIQRGSTTYIFSFTAVSKSDIQTEMDSLKELALSKIEEAKNAAISDAKALLEVDAFSSFVKKTLKDKIYNALKTRDPLLASMLQYAETTVKKFTDLQKAYKEVTNLDLNSASEDTVMKKVKNYNTKVEAYQKAIEAIVG